MSDPAVIPPELALDGEPFSMDELDALLRFADTIEPGQAIDTVEIPTAARAPGSWGITDMGSAEWAMRHYAQHSANIDALAVQAEEWRAKIDHWLAQATKQVEARRAYFASLLIAYAAERRAADPKGPKTLTLPSGVVKSSDRQAAVRVVDREAAAADARAQLSDEEYAEVVTVPAPIADTAKVKALTKVVEVVTSRTFRVETDGGPVDIERAGDEPAIEPGHEFEWDDGLDRVTAEALAVELVEQRTTQQVVWADTGKPAAGCDVAPAETTYKVAAA